MLSRYVKKCGFYILNVLFINVLTDSFLLFTNILFKMLKGPARWPWGVKILLEMALLSFKCFYFPSNNFAFLQRLLLSFKYFLLLSFKYFLFAFFQIFLLSFKYFFAFLQIFFCFPSNIFAFLQIFFLLSFKYFLLSFKYFLLLSFKYIFFCFPSNIFAFLQIFKFPS